MGKSAEVVVIGAGIAGTAAAYHLAVRRKIKRVVVVDARDPLTLTSDKGTQGYRNWWPGPDATMLQFVSRSIDIMEELARESRNAIRLSRRGYLFATAREEQAAAMRSTAEQVSAFGMGKLREHPGDEAYAPAAHEGFENFPFGADLLMGDAARAAFPYINRDMCAALHIRRAGWMNGLALGTYSFYRAISAGAEFVRDRVAGIRVENGRVCGVRLASGDEIATGKIVIAAGPLLSNLGRMLDLELPLVHELHAKITFRDTLGALPRSAPFLIWTDTVQLEWSSADRERLGANQHDRRLLDEMPGGVHVRPVDGAFGDELWLIWTYENDPCIPTWPPTFRASYPEAVMRGITAMIPAMTPYAARGAEAYVDGGYYCKTRENRPLVGPLPVEGAYVCGALSGYGVMAAHGAGDLVAAHVAGTALPDYYRWFLPSRYDDPLYLEAIKGWGALVGQL